MHQATPIASFALFASVPLVIWLFLSQSRDVAAAITVIAAPLFLPERVMIDVPYLELDKNTLPSIVAVIMLTFGKKAPIRGKSSFFVIMAIVIILSNAATVLNNQHPISVAPGVVLPGLNKTNIVTRCVNACFQILFPFWLGRRAFRTPEAATTLLKVMTTLGFVYTFLMLIELRMSPQVNVWVYGFHQHSFAQAVRDGGYRPMVFMNHGLAATMYLVLAIFAAVSLGKAKESTRFASPYRLAAFMTLVLMFCNSMGSIIYGIFIPPILLLAPPRFITRMATWGSFVILAVPLMRSMQLIPLDDILNFISENLSADRAGSLGFRFENEELLLAKWEHQPWFGYGIGRNSVYNSDGYSVSVFDGAWIIILSSYGMIGFLTTFTLFLGPIWMAKKSISKPLEPKTRIIFTAIAMMVLVSTFELLINGLYNNILIVLAGALCGLSETLTADRKAPRHAALPTG